MLPKSIAQIPIKHLIIIGVCKTGKENSKKL